MAVNIKGILKGFSKFETVRVEEFDPFPNQTFSVSHDYARSEEGSDDIFHWDRPEDRELFEAQGMTVSANIAYPVAVATVTADGYYVYTPDGLWPTNWDEIVGTVTFAKGSQRATYPFQIFKSAS